jgi:lysophospholipase L1-like esterase
MRVLAAAVAALWLSGCGNAITSPSSVTPATWVFLGSSTTAGFTTSSPSLTWVSRLERALTGRNITIVNLASAGASTYNWMPAAAPPPAGRPGPWLANNIDAAMARRPALVLLNATTNDLAADYRADETVANVLAIRTVAIAGGAAVLVLSTQPRDLPDPQRAQLPLIDERLAAETGGCFIDIRTPLAGGDNRLAPGFDSGDGIHPNDAGHEVIFQRVNATLSSGRCIPAP